MPGSFEVGDLVTADLLNTATYRPYCKMHQTVSQTGLGTSTIVFLSFTTEDHDPEGWHDNVTNNSRVTPTLAGEYEVTVEGVMVASTTLQALWAGIYLNGVQYSRSGNQKPSTNSNTTASPTWTDTVTLNGTTDYLEMAMGVVSSVSTEATGITGSSGQSRMIVRFLGANA